MLNKKETYSANNIKPVKEIKLADKPVQVFNNYPIPSKKLIEKTYNKIPDDTRIPLQFMTREQYVKQYVGNQEKQRGRPFDEKTKKEFFKNKKDKYSNIIGRYTTKQNPYYPPAVVIFNDPENQQNIKGKNFKKVAWHEYGHELAEKKKLNLDYETEEYFADRIADKGLKKNPFCDTRAKNKILQEIQYFELPAKDNYSKDKIMYRGIDDNEKKLLEETGALEPHGDKKRIWITDRKKIAEMYTPPEGTILTIDIDDDQIKKADGRSRMFYVDETIPKNRIIQKENKILFPWN